MPTKEEIGLHRRNLENYIKQIKHQETKTVFADFCKLAAITLANSCDPQHLLVSKETWNKRENLYKQTIRKYDRETQFLFPKMFAELVKELQVCMDSGHCEDILGEVFRNLGLHKNHRNAFPEQAIFDLLIDILENKVNEEKEFITVSDPCCRSGMLICSHINNFLKNKRNPSKELFVSAEDADELCVHMCYIQCSLYGIPAIVTLRNVLDSSSSEEIDESNHWLTPVYCWEGWIFKLRGR